MTVSEVDTKPLLEVRGLRCTSRGLRFDDGRRAGQARMTRVEAQARFDRQGGGIPPRCVLVRRPRYAGAPIRSLSGPGNAAAAQPVEQNGHGQIIGFALFEIAFENANSDGVNFGAGVAISGGHARP